MRVKTDHPDAGGIAQLVRLGWFKCLHAKSLNAQATRALLTARIVLDEPTEIDRKLTALATSDTATRRLVTTPGVGVIGALSFRSAVDDPGRFPHRRDVRAWISPTPRR
ncbi:MAG: transposase [Pseudomonadota bacterium]